MAPKFPRWHLWDVLDKESDPQKLDLKDLLPDPTTNTTSEISVESMLHEGSGGFLLHKGDVYNIRQVVLMLGRLGDDTQL